MFLNDDINWKTGLKKIERANFVKNAANFILEDGILYLKTEERYKEIIADDDEYRLNLAVKSLHLPDHTGMKAKYENCR